METIEETTAEVEADPGSHPELTTLDEDIVAERLRDAGTTDEERACIVASCIGQAVGKFSALRLTESDIVKNPLYRLVKDKFEG